MSLFNHQLANPNKESGKITVECPSNIALIKYWGKYENQIPANSSISFTLSNSKTITEFNYIKSKDFQVTVNLNGESKIAFAEKIKKYFLSIKKYLPFIEDYSYSIETKNTFPHSSGIASSASGFGAISKALIQMRSELYSNDFQNQKKETSFLARLGSGSASRSIYNGLVVWGKNQKIEGSSDEYAIKYPYDVHPVFKTYKDTILLIHEGEKSVSSTVGHGLMNNHYYADLRFKEANENLQKLIPILKSGNIEEFNQMIEHEALTLHAMMMMSNPAFLLMKPNTVACIEKIWKFRELTKKNLCFTLDAGANIHLLYPEEEAIHIESFINNDLIKYTQNGNILKDKVLF